MATAEMTLKQEDLQQFTGSENWYRHGINNNVLFTDGAKYVADAGGAYWLLDQIALAQLHVRRVKAESFQVWTLTVCEDRSATLVCDDGDHNVVYTQEIEYTDFPLSRIKLFFDTCVIMLPNEY
jgi:hypothetical protein